MDATIKTTLELFFEPKPGKALSLEVECPRCVVPSRTWIPEGCAPRSHDGREGLAVTLRHGRCGRVARFFTVEGEVYAPLP